MNQKELVEYQKKVEAYIQEHKMTDIFENLTRLLVLSRPENPLTFLIDVLENRRVQRLIFVSGPLANYRNEVVHSIANLFYYRVISAEELFQGDVGWVDNSRFNQKILEAIKATERQFRGIIVSGYPNNLNQARFIQTQGLLPERVFFFETDKLEIKQYYNSFQAQETEQSLIRDELNRRELDQIFSQYLDIFNTSTQTKDDIIENIKSIIKLRDRKYPPLRFPRVCVIRPPGLKERAQGLVELLSKRYGLKSIITFQVLEKAIQNKGALGPLIQDALMNQKTIPADIINSLIYTEVLSTEARTKGWIIEGYPKNEEQVNFLEQQNANLYIILNEEEEILFSKYKQLKIDKVTKVKYEKVPINNKQLLERLVNYQINDDDLRLKIRSYQQMIKQLEKKFGESVQVFKLEKDLTDNIVRIADVFLNNPKIYN